MSDQAAESAAAIASYTTELDDLTWNSKPIINSLTMIAGELLPLSADIAELIRRKILGADSDKKLPVVYLLDSICKNIGKDYRAHFAKHLPELMANAHGACGPKVRTSLQALTKTWNGLFPPEVLREVHARMAPSQRVAAIPPVLQQCVPPPPSAPTAACGSCGGGVAAEASARKRPRDDAVERKRLVAEKDSLVQRVTAHLEAQLPPDEQLVGFVSRAIVIANELFPYATGATEQGHLRAQLADLQRLQAAPRLARHCHAPQSCRCALIRATARAEHAPPPRPGEARQRVQSHAAAVRAAAAAIGGGRRRAALRELSRRRRPAARLRGRRRRPCEHLHTAAAAGGGS